MLKVYLSKSNLCSSERVARVRDALRLDPAIEILEHVGNGYSNQLLLDADVLFMVTPDDIFDNDDTVLVGRGQFEQMRQFIAKSTVGPVFIATEVDMDRLDVDFREASEVCTYDTTNWKREYGQITLRDDNVYHWISVDRPDLRHPSLSQYLHKRHITTNPCAEIGLPGEHQLPRPERMFDENGNVIGLDFDPYFNEIERRLRSKKILSMARSLGII
jgi:hypothetical protein